MQFDSTPNPAGAPVTLLDWALIYRRLGLPVFPVCPALVSHTHRERTRQGDRVIWSRVTCTKMGKTPLVAWAEYQAMVPAEGQIGSWWQRWPDANIGLACGALSGVVVVDLDGDLAVRTAADMGDLPSGPFSYTGRVGGQHRFFAWRAEAPTLFSKRSGIDFRGQGGYVILPPSMHISRTAYRWGWALDEDSLADLPALPDWVITLGGEREVPLVRGAESFGWVPQTDIPEGTRDNTLMSIAGFLRGEEGLDEYEIGLRLEAVNQDFCKPPVTLADVLRISHSAAKYAINPPDEKLSGRLEGDPAFRLAGITPGVDEAAGIPSRNAGLEFMTLEDWRNQTQQAVDWVCAGLVGKGLVTELVAYPKVGKTVLALHLVRGMLSGETDFCGLELTPGRALYLTEEGYATFYEELDLHGLLPIEDGLLTVPQALFGGRRWSLVCSDAVRTARAQNIDLIIIDTLSALAGVDDEDSSARSQEVMAQARKMANAGFAVLYLRHARKSGGPVGHSGRGSSAYAGAADILLDLDYVSGDKDGSSNQRELRGKGRHRLTPAVLPLALVKGRYLRRAEDSPPVKLHGEDTRPVWEALAEELFQRGCHDVTSGASIDDLAVYLRRGPAAIRQELVNRVTLGQVAEGRFQRSPRGQPTRVFWLPSGLIPAEDPSPRRGGIPAAGIDDENEAPTSDTNQTEMELE